MRRLTRLCDCVALSLSQPYPDHTWFQERNWAEQFVLQAFLSNNPYYDVIWCGGALSLPFAKQDRISPEDAEQFRSTAISAFGRSGAPFFHLREVGFNRPFAGGGSMWLRRTK